MIYTTAADLLAPILNIPLQEITSEIDYAYTAHTVYTRRAKLPSEIFVPKSTRNLPVTQFFKKYMTRNLNTKEIKFRFSKIFPGGLDNNRKNILFLLNFSQTIDNINGFSLRVSVLNGKAKL